MSNTYFRYFFFPFLGDMVTVDNTRLMHGRTELSGAFSGRHLQCGYMDWDEIECRIRVLREEQM